MGNNRCYSLIAIAALCLLASNAWATVVWNLNPTNLNQATGTSQTYTTGGQSITAFGFNNNNGTGRPQQLFFKHENPINAGVEFGLGVANTADHEVQANSNGSPFDFIQFNLTSILKAGAANGGISVSSVQAGETFALYGSNKLGTLGTKLGGTFGSSSDNTFVNLPNFGKFDFYSVVAVSGDVLPSELRADFPAVPEMNALLPISVLAAMLVAGEMIRRRRVARG